MNEKCTGLIFKGFSSVFKRASGHYEHSQGFRLLKRKSCKCGDCKVLLEYIDDCLCDGCCFNVNGHVDNGVEYTIKYDGDDFYFYKYKDGND